MTDKLDAERLRALDEAATAGPWRDAGGDAVLAGADKLLSVVASFGQDVDRDLVNYLRNAVPAILAMAEDHARMREAAQAYMNAIRDLGETNPDKVTYFEASPTNDPECHWRWVQLNNTGKAISELISKNGGAA